MKDGKERLRERIEGIDCREQIAESRFRIICKGRLNVNDCLLYTSDAADE